MDFSLFLYFCPASRTLDTTALHSDEAKSTKGKKKSHVSKWFVNHGQKISGIFSSSAFPFPTFLFTTNVLPTIYFPDILHSLAQTFF